MTRIQYEGRKDIINIINMDFSFPHSTTNALHLFWTEQKWKIEELKNKKDTNAIYSNWNWNSKCMHK